MSLFVRVVTHYGSNESNDSLGVFSEGSRKCGSTGAALLGNGRPNWGNDANWEKKENKKKEGQKRNEEKRGKENEEEEGMKRKDDKD